MVEAARSRRGVRGRAAIRRASSSGPQERGAAGAGEAARRSGQRSRAGPHPHSAGPGRCSPVRGAAAADGTDGPRRRRGVLAPPPRNRRGRGLLRDGPRTGGRRRRRHHVIPQSGQEADGHGRGQAVSLEAGSCVFWGVGGVGMPGTALWSPGGGPWGAPGTIPSSRGGRGGSSAPPRKRGPSPLPVYLQHPERRGAPALRAPPLVPVASLSGLPAASLFFLPAGPLTLSATGPRIGSFYLFIFFLFSPMFVRAVFWGLLAEIPQSQPFSAPGESPSPRTVPMNWGDSSALLYP